MVELRILGLPQLVASDGHPIDALARQAKRTALLAYLAAANPRGFQRRDKLVALFWPDLDAPHARNALSQALHVLRSTLGDGAVLTRGDQEVGLSAEVVWCDVPAFECALHAGRLAEAAALYRGDLLDGLFVPGAPEFERWLDSERTRLRQRASEGAWALAEAKAAEGDAVEAQRWARRATDFVPADEAVVRRLMTFLTRLGDRAAAIRAYEAFAWQLAHEYELEPSAETQSLAAVIREKGQRPTVPEPTKPAATLAAIGVTRSMSPAFVQRTHRLRGTWSFIRLLNVGAAALAIVVAVAGGAFLVTSRLDGFDAQAALRVVVIPFENRTGDAEFDALGVMAADWVTQALTEAPSLTVLDTRSALGAARRLGAGGTPAAVGRETGAGLVIAGSYFLQGDSVQFQAQIASTTDGHILFGLGDVMAPRGRPLEAVEQLRQRALAAVVSLHDKEVTAFQTRLTHLPTYAAYREYTEGLELYIRNDFSEATRRFERAAVVDTSFLVARLWAVQGWLPPRPGNLIAVDSLLEGLHLLRDNLGPFQRAQLDFLTAQRARDFRDAYRAALRMVETAPASINARREAALSALRVLRPREARTRLAQLDAERGLMRHWPEYWSVVAWSDHLLAEYDRELVAARHGRALDPASGLFRFLELRALAALGRTLELDSLVRAELFAIPGQSGLLARAIVGELLAHGHREAAQRLAQYAAGLVAGRPPSEQTAQEWLQQRAALGVFTGESEVLDYFSLERAAARSSFERAKDEWLHERAELALLLGDVDAAGNFVAQFGDPNVHGLLLARLAAAQGRHDAARAALRGAERRHLARWGSLRGLELDRASVLVGIGDVEGALAVLTEGLTRGLIWDSVWGNDGHGRPDLAPLWRDRRFQQLITSRG